MFTALYGLRPYIKWRSFFFKGLNSRTITIWFVIEGRFTMKLVNEFLYTPCYSLETLCSYT